MKSSASQAQELILPDAAWYWHPERRVQEAGYTLFRKIFHTPSPAPLRLAVSADNRYNLYLDGRLIGRGPCRSDLRHYVYEEYAEALPPGFHTLAVEVVVWRGGWRQSAAPWSEIHAGGGLLVCGYAGSERLDLPEGWSCKIDAGRRPLEWSEAWGARILTPVPPMDEVNFKKFDCNWQRTAAADWVAPVEIGPACLASRCRLDPATPWLLIPRAIRQMQTEFHPISTILHASGLARVTVRNGRLQGWIPTGRCRLLLDLGRNQTSIITLRGRGGNGRTRLAYSEKLFRNGKRTAWDDASGEIAQNGYADQLILPESGRDWLYRSFWYRSGRFIELDFDLNSDLDALELQTDFITYPFQCRAEFHAPGRPVLEKIWRVALHTARCCAHEHYEDCPYYEQLQYAGDTRIQALISYAAAGDDALGRQAIRSFSWSRLGSGLTQSRYPSTFSQVIPQFSLIWILMIHDHYRYFGDPGIIRENRDGIRSVLSYFENLRTPGELIGGTGFWNFTDWAPGWSGGRSDRGSGEPETIINLFYSEACRAAAELNALLGFDRDAASYRDRRDRTIAAVNACCWDKSIQRYQDVPGRDSYSVHVNMLAVIADAVPAGRQRDFAAEVVNDRRLIPASLYFSFYVLEALRKCGDTVNFFRALEPWEKLLERGFTTFPETPSAGSRSECHAWSASPVYEFITGILGGEPVRAGVTALSTRPLPSIPESWRISGRLP